MQLFYTERQFLNLTFTLTSNKFDVHSVKGSNQRYMKPVKSRVQFTCSMLQSRSVAQPTDVG